MRVCFQQKIISCMIKNAMIHIYINIYIYIYTLYMCLFQVQTRTCTNIPINKCIFKYISGHLATLAALSCLTTGVHMKKSPTS